MAKRITVGKVPHEDHLRVLCCLDKYSVVWALYHGLKLDNIQELRMMGGGRILVVANGEEIKLNVKEHLIEW